MSVKVFTKITDIENVSQNNSNFMQEQKIQLTKSILEDVVLESFLNGNSCRLKKISRDSRAFGQIDITDAIYGKYLVKKDDGERLKYNSIDDLVSDGWLVD